MRDMSRTELIEWIAMVVAVVAIWPISFGYLGAWPAWLRLAYYAVLLGAMVKILLNRAARIRRAIQRPRDDEPGRGG